MKSGRFAAGFDMYSFCSVYASAYVVLDINVLEKMFRICSRIGTYGNDPFA